MLRQHARFYSQLATLIATLGTIYGSTYAGFTAARTIQGFTAAAPQVLGLSMIYDMFFFHNRTRVINVWALSFLLGPYLLPLVSGFLIESLTWEQCFAVLCGFFGFSVLVITIFGDETLFNRDGFQHERTPGIKGQIYRLTGIDGIRAQGRPSLWATTQDLFELLLKPYLILPCLGYM
jgi:MFS family permease